jgi:zinc transport system permease protein
VRGVTARVLVAFAAGVLASVSGVLGSYYADTAPGALIVVLALAGFGLAAVVGTVVRRRPTPSSPGRTARLPEEATVR